jgi:hypothetical protein
MYRVLLTAAALAGLFAGVAGSFIAHPAWAGVL